VKDARPVDRRDDLVEITVSEPWIEVDLGDDWTAAYRIVIQDGAPVVAELRVFLASTVR